MIISGQLPLFVRFLVQINQHKLTKNIVVKYFMVTPVCILRTRHACKFVSFDIEHHFLFKNIRY